MSCTEEIAPPGSTVGQYEIIGHIGQGVTAHVYKAFDHAREELVALKKLHPSREGNIGINQLLYEAQVGRLVTHHAIVTIHDFKTGSEGTTLSMELVEGQSLDSRIESEDIADEDLPVIGEQLPDILEGLREAGVIHRDIVPQNLIYNDGEIKLCDFGSACTERESNKWRLPNLMLRWLRDYAPDNPGFIGSRRAFPLVYFLGARPTYSTDEHAATLVREELEARLSSNVNASIAVGSSLLWQDTVTDNHL